MQVKKLLGNLRRRPLLAATLPLALGSAFAAYAISETTSGSPGHYSLNTAYDINIGMTASSGCNAQAVVPLSSSSSTGPWSSGHGYAYFTG